MRSYSIVHTVRDSVQNTLVSKEYIKVTVPMRYNVTGTVLQSDGLTAVANSYVYLKQGGHTRKIVKSADGTFSFSNVLPGAYTIHVYKSGVTFGADVAVSVVSANVAQNVTATNP